MRNLFYFIIRHHFLILFVLIEGFSIFMVIQYNDYQRSCFINSSASVSGKVNKSFSFINKYFSLKQQNEALIKELASERNKAADSYYQKKITPLQIFDSVYVQQYEYIPGTVVNNSISRPNNYLTLNVGSSHGVKPGMGVVSAQGVVGIVKDVSSNFSSVISLLNQNIKVSAMVKKDGYFGSLYWNGADYEYAIIEDLPGHLHLIHGDTIITSGYSTTFPKGQLIGYVDTALNEGSGSLLSAKIKLGVDFKKIAHVLVVKNLMKNEQVELENLAEHE
jgi:rod shape-determining protein MreC